MDKRSCAPRQYAFGPFRLSADAALLTCDGKALRLAPKVLQTLMVLVRHAGSVVSKRALMEAVWPDTFVEETGLTRNISVLRKALGTRGEQLIETMPSVGYRFVAAVEVVEADGPQQGTADEVAELPGTPFVGRIAEMARLNAALRRADAGRGSALGLAGEPGIGKSTLADRFLSTASVRREVGVGRCSELYGTAEPHLPVLEALEAVTASRSASALLARLAPTWVRHVTGRSPEDAGGPQAASTEHLLRELTRFLAEFSRERPVIWLLEDVHWADTGTIDVIAHLAPRLGQMHMLLVLTYRDRELELRQHPFAGVLATLRGRRSLDEIALPLLTRAEVAEYVAMAAGADAAGVNDDIYARSEGNPLFMSALVGQLVETSPGGPPGPGIPDSVRGLIARPLGHLADDQRDVLDAAAVAGYSFDARVVSRVLRLDPLTLEDRLEEVAHAQGLVLRETRGHAHERDAPAWRFRHALYHAMLLEQLPPSRRARLSRDTVDALTALHGEGDRSVAGTLALLLEAARAFPEAAARFAGASRHAAQQLAHKDAYQLAERGMRCLERATELSAEARRPLELELTLAKLVPLSSLRGYGHPTVEALVQRASDLAATLGDRVAMAHTYIQMVFVRLVRGEGQAARDAARRLIGVAESLGNDPLLVNAHLQAQIACHHLGHFADADQHASTVLRLGERLRPDERFFTVFDPVIASLAESSRNAWITGRLATAERLAARALAVGEEVGNHDSLAFAWLFHAWVHGYKGDWGTCVASAAAGMAVADAAATPQTLAWNRCVHGWARAHLGTPHDGARELEDGVRLSQSISGEVAMPQFRAMMVEVLRLGGQEDAARRWLMEALEASVDHDDDYFSAEIHRLAAACAPTTNGATAREHLERALSIADAQGAGFFHVRAALDLHALTGDVRPLHNALLRVTEPVDWPDVSAARLCLHGAAPPDA